MSKFNIVVEATADLTDELLKKYDIKKIDMNYSIDETEYDTSNVSMTPSIFYEKMKEGAKTSTSQVTTFQATEFYNELLKDGKDVLHVCFSSGLSGTYNNVSSVAGELNKSHKNKILVVDSLCASAGQGLLAILASLKQDECETIEELRDYVESIKQNLTHLFVVDHLKYLARTGRISKFTAKLGSILQIKPVLHVDEKGLLTPVKKVISRKKSIYAIVDAMSTLKNDISNKVIIAQADCMEDAELLKSLVLEKFNVEIEIVELGFVIGSHSGPGTLALFFTGDHR